MSMVRRWKKILPSRSLFGLKKKEDGKAEKSERGIEFERKEEDCVRTYSAI